MFFDPDEKDEKEEALKKLKDVMMSGMGERFGKAKKPADDDTMLDDVNDAQEDNESDLDDRDSDREINNGDESDEEDLEELQDLGRQHKKYCMGGKV